jgi:uncharacterized membrane protein YphA (DoxX/SURF4 family)
MDSKPIGGIAMKDKRLDSAYWALRAAFGLVPVVAGLDKFTNLLVDWKTYLSPIAIRLMPISPSSFMHVVGIVEIAVGVLVLFAATRLGAYVAAAWLACIAVNILASGTHLDVAVRDLVMALGAYTLARLEEVRAGGVARETARAVEPARAPA